MPTPRQQAEPWLSGTQTDKPLLVRPLFFCFEQVRQELQSHASELTSEQIWRKVGPVAPLGFHLRHIPGSVDRLLTYLEDRQLGEQQLQYLKHEGEPGAEFHQLYTGLDHQLRNAEQRLLQLDLTDLDAQRFIGRRRLQVTFLGLLVHIAEHTQRHLGQAVTMAKLVSD